MDTANCPGRAELEGFVVGSLADPILVRIANHLQHCPACEAALEMLDPLADPLLSGLRRLTTTDDVGSRVRAAPTDRRGPFGWPAERRGLGLALGRGTRPCSGAG